MGFMDKVKSQATQLAEKAQEGARVGQEKLGQFQGKRQSDALLLELGGITYLSQEGRADASSSARASELIAQLQAFEAEHGQITVTSAQPPAPPEPPAAAGGGGFIPGGGGSAVPQPSAGASSPTIPTPPDPSVWTGTAGAPGAGGIPTGTVGGIPTGSVGVESAGDPPPPPAAGGIPTGSVGGIPTASHSSDEEQADS